MAKNDLLETKQQLDELLGDSDIEGLKDVIQQLVFQNKSSDELNANLEENIKLSAGQKDKLTQIIEIVSKLKIVLPEVFSVMVKNPTREVKINNLAELEEIRISNLPEPVAFPSEIKVNNLKDIKIPSKVDINRPEWLEMISKKDLTDILINLVRAISKGDGLKVDLDRYLDSKRPIAVRLSDSKGFYRAISQAIQSSGGGSGYQFRTASGTGREALVTDEGYVVTTPIEVIPTEGQNPSLVISDTDMVEDSTQTITKTISGTSYQKTLSKNAAGIVIGVSAWVAI